MAEVGGRGYGWRPSSGRSAVPSEKELNWPTLLVLQSFGGRAVSKPDIAKQVAARMQLSDSVARIPHFRADGRHGDTKLEYRVAWVLTRLKKLGAATNPRPGYWCTTEFGQKVANREELAVGQDTQGSGPLPRPGPMVRRPGPAASASWSSSSTRKSQREWVLESMEMLGQAGVTGASLDRIEHAARALGWNGNSKSLRSAVWIAKREGLLVSERKGHYRLPDTSPVPLNEEPANSGSAVPNVPHGTQDRDVHDTLAASVEKLADAVAGLAEALGELNQDQSAHSQTSRG